MIFKHQFPNLNQSKKTMNFVSSVAQNCSTFTIKKKKSMEA